MKLLKSFSYAFQGVGYCIRSERNFRIHIVASATVFAFSLLYGIERSQIFPLLFAVFSVLILESLNTAIEAAIDLLAKDYHPLAKVAKDTAAGTVLLAALCAVITAVCVFHQPDKLQRAFRLLSTPWGVAGIVLFAVLALWFIFGWSQGKQSLKAKEKEKPL